MKQFTTIIALFFFLLPLVAIAQQSRISTGTTITPLAADSAYYIEQVVFRPVTLWRGEEKMPMLNHRGFVRPEVKAKFEPYPNAYRELLLSERHNRKSLFWARGSLLVGTTALVYLLATINKDAKYENAVLYGGALVTSGLAVTTYYHFGKAIKSRRKAVDYLNVRQ